ncbi:MAG TPA: ECF-type sigma factor [Candidatus Krumholzibacteria bacterium]|nr:ECF-type sigma factor [Candidatus Krumholzibacteria bacterium]
MDARGEVTRLLGELAGGDESAFDRLIPIVYQDLRRIAQRHMRHQDVAITVNATALVHEAYLRLVDQTQIHWKDCDHFLSVYSVVMRNLLVDMARRRRSIKHGGERTRVTLEPGTAAIDHQVDHLLAVDEAMTRLAEIDARLARVVECRFFAGFSEKETASALGVTERTVQRDWVKARAILSEWIDAN